MTLTHTHAVCTYMVPLQEHQRPALVLSPQLLSSLLHGQLGLSQLLTLHGTPAHGYRLDHGGHGGGLRLAHKHTVRSACVWSRCDQAEPELTCVSAGHLSVLSGPPGSLFRSSLSHRLGSVLTGGSISPHMINLFCGCNQTADVPVERCCDEPSGFNWKV